MSMDIRDGHALDLIAAFDGEADLICTDPPYAMGGEGAEHALSATVATGDPAPGAMFDLFGGVA